jgi:hypothetical protein
MENINLQELQLGYEKYLKIKQRTNECSKKWIKEHKENARKNNKTYYDKIKADNPEKYNEMLKKKTEQKRARDEKAKITLDEKKKEVENGIHPTLAILYNL